MILMKKAILNKILMLIMKIMILFMVLSPLVTIIVEEESLKENRLVMLMVVEVQIQIQIL